MRKFILLTLFGSGLSSIAIAQARDHYVIAAQGGSATTPVLTLDWTLGEIATESAYSNHQWFTQGFHQPYIQVKELLSQSTQISTRGTYVKESDYTITVSPNPSSTTLEVQLNGLDDQEVEVFISDGSGKRLLSEMIALGSGTAHLDLGHLATGLYILSCYSPDKGLLSVFKISKI